MKLRSFSFRRAVPDDIAALKNLYHATVLTINRRDYSKTEVADWASCGDDLCRWKELIETLYFIVAESPRSQIVGFSSINQQGHLHSMFVHKDFQGKGIATMLLDEIERYAKESGIEKITSDVSITARPFFERRNYSVEAQQKRRANQLYLTNFLMTKTIDKI
ncbi:MAG: GNAT family N-acetyltransferase [Prolixibacteraceae bacterium]|nr:GNAT family N-acetyltransferase [Prolixibacteraceae bacterium]